MKTRAILWVGLVAALLGSSPASAQEEKNPHKDTHWSWSANVTPAQMKTIIERSGFRIIDLEVARRLRSSSPSYGQELMAIHAILVAHYNISGATLTSIARSTRPYSRHRVMTLKPDARFAVVYVKDPGNNAAWNWTADPSR